MTRKSNRIGRCAALGITTALAIWLAPATALAAGAPAVESQKVDLGGADTATIEAEVEPDGHATTCLVEYTSEEAFQVSQWSGASKQSCGGPALEGTGVQAASAHLSGLNVATAYRYRVLASSEAGSATGPGAYFSTFGIESFSFQAINEHGEPYTQAGGHPFELVTTIDFNTTFPENPAAETTLAPVELDGVERDIELELPPGLIGNPRPFPKCSYQTLEEKDCNPESQIGTIEVSEEDGVTRRAGFYDLEAPPGVAARFGARINKIANATIEAGVRSGSDYGIDVDSFDITGFGTVTGLTVRLWGVPASPLHDNQRFAPESGGSNADNAPETPFLSLPTSCSGTPLFTGLSADSYQAIGNFARASQELPLVQGCGNVTFAPEIATVPTTSAAESPSGLAVDLHVPQDVAPGQSHESPTGLRSADLRDAVVTLPTGLTVNPSSAAGLTGCSAEQIGLSGATEVDDEQRIVVEPRLDSSFTLSFEGEETVSIGSHASAAAVQEDLEALPRIGAGNVEVVGGAGGAFIARFVGALAGRSVPTLVATAARPAVERLELQTHEAAPNQLFSNDSFEVALDGHSTAATIAATAHLDAEDPETRVIGYIEDSAITSEAGKLVTGEAITGPEIPAQTRIRLVPGRIVLLKYDNGANTYTQGEHAGTFEVSIPDTAFSETVRSALEALPSIGRANVAGGPGGESPVLGPQVDSSFTITYTPAEGDEAGPLTVTPAIEEAAQTLTPTYSPAGSRAVTVSVIQPGGVPHLNGQPATCPSSSQIGTVEIDTPLLEAPLSGAVYLATPFENPFNSLVALYVAVHDPISGVVVKLAGHVEIGLNGQLTTTFDENPQLPFEDLKLTLREGPRAPLMTPATCGTYEATSTLTPWSAPESGSPATPASLLTVGSEPGGGSCPTTPSAQTNAPAFEGGSESTQAGAYTPFVVHLTREDGSQRFSQVVVTPPRGLLGRVAGVPRCPEADIAAAAAASGDAEQASPSCPVDSELGTVTVGAGAGSEPLNVHGHVYFAGPYDGAPFSLAIVTPALAGPFDLGTVVVRAGIYINSQTAQVTVKSDPIPTELDNIPLDVRSITVDLSRGGFTLNPTDCEELAVTGQEISTVGQTASLSDGFHASGCQQLAFKPSFTAHTSARTSRKDGAGLTVNLAFPRSGGANTARVKVRLPKRLATRESTLKLACTETQFAANPAGCPEGSRVGVATAVTPILAVPLHGPVYFVSRGGAAFPELVAVLQGEGVTIELAGETFIGKTGVTTSTFKAVPDAPVTSFQMELPEGKFSVLAAPEGKLCAHRLVIPTVLTGQNGKVVEQSTRIAVDGCAYALKLVAHKVQKRVLTLKVVVPGAGTLQIAGRGLPKKTKRSTGTETIEFKIKPRRAGKLASKLHAVFTPKSKSAHKKKLRKTVAVKFPR